MCFLQAYQSRQDLSPTTKDTAEKHSNASVVALLGDKKWIDAIILQLCIIGHDITVL